MSEELFDKLHAQLIACEAKTISALQKASVAMTVEELHSALDEASEFKALAGELSSWLRGNKKVVN